MWISQSLIICVPILSLSQHGTDSIIVVRHALFYQLESFIWIILLNYFIKTKGKFMQVRTNEIRDKTSITKSSSGMVEEGHSIWPGNCFIIVYGHISQVRIACFRPQMVSPPNTNNATLLLGLCSILYYYYQRSTTDHDDLGDRIEGS